MKKTSIIFVGSFSHLAKSGHVGGMTKMCQYIFDSHISEKVNWHLVDSTAPHNRMRGFLTRLFPAIKRLLLFFWLLITKKVDKVFVFAAQGLGFYEKGLMIMMAKAFNKQTIMALRSGFLIKDIEQSSSFRKRAKQIFSKIDIVVCQGSNWLEFLEKQVNVQENKVVIIPNCVELPKVSAPVSVSQPVRLLFMGFVEKNKGIYDIIDALSSIKEDNWRLDIAGKGIAMHDIQAKLLKSPIKNSVEFHGWVTGKTKEQLLNEADILLLPSYWEGMPNVILEAMARNTAVISTDVGAIPDLIDSGENGYILKPGDVNHLTNHINTYLRNIGLIEQHKERGKLKIQKSFTVDRIIPKFAEILIEE